MIDQRDPLQFIESQISGLRRFNRRLEDVLPHLNSIASYQVLDAIGNPPEFEFDLDINGNRYVGYGVNPREAVLNCLEKAKEALGKNNRTGTDKGK